MPVYYTSIEDVKKYLAEIETLNTKVENLKSELKQKNSLISELESYKTTGKDKSITGFTNSLLNKFNQKDLRILNQGTVETKLDELIKSIAKLTSLDSEINKLQSVIQQKDLRISELEPCQTSFEDVSKIYKSYKDNGVKEYLSCKLNFSDNNDFIRTHIYFGQKMNLDNLWLCVREKAINDKESKIFNKLRDFLYLVMEEFFITHPKYAFIDESIIQNQDHLDYEVHETSKIKRGTVSTIILKGYYSKISNNILKKSLVALE